MFRDVETYIRLILDEYERDFYLYGYTSLKSDIINDIEYMPISGIEPSSVILSQTMYY